MADPSLPIVFQKLFDLPQLGINPEFIKFGNLTMEGDQNLCIREGAQIALMNLKNGMIQRRPIQADGAIYSANEVLALRSGATVQSYSMTQKQKLGTFQVPEGDSIGFWRWVNDSEVAFITANAVFHWNALQATAQPRKVFDRHASLLDCQVINYQVSQDSQWSLVVGIKKGAEGIEGQMQLYSVDKRVSQPLKGHAGAFAQITVQGRRAQVFCFAEMKPGSAPKLFVMELGRDPAQGPGFKIAPQDIPFPPDAAGDFPVSMQVSSKHDILFMMTKMGYLFLFDLHSGTCLFRKRVSPDPVFATCPHTATNGILGITAGKGAVLSVSLNERNLVPFVRDTLKKPELALELAGRLGLPGAEKLYVERFQGLIQSGDIQGAAQVAATSPGGILRTADTIRTFQGLPAQPGSPQPLLQCVCRRRRRRRCLSRTIAVRTRKQLMCKR
jgi:clathrin heavy chain